MQLLGPLCCFERETGQHAVWQGSCAVAPNRTVWSPDIYGPSKGALAPLCYGLHFLSPFLLTVSWAAAHRSRSSRAHTPVFLPPSSLQPYTCYASTVSLPYSSYSPITTVLYVLPPTGPQPTQDVSKLDASVRPVHLLHKHFVHPLQ